MDLKHDADARTPQTRRRGAALEAAILESAWSQLLETGYDGFTFDAIAKRAQTSRSVLARRWDSRPELLRAAIAHHGRTLAPIIVDTGSVRGDLIAALAIMGRERADVVAAVTVLVQGYFADTGSNPAELRKLLARDRINVIEMILRRGANRGEIDPARLTPRTIALPGDLVRHHLAFTLAPVSESDVTEIVDEIVLPALEFRAR